MFYLTSTERESQLTTNDVGVIEPKLIVTNGSPLIENCQREIKEGDSSSNSS